MDVGFIYVCLVDCANMCYVLYEKYLKQNCIECLKVRLCTDIYCQNSMLHIVMSVKLQFHYDFLFT